MTQKSKKIGTKGRFDVPKLYDPTIRDAYLSRIDRKISSRPVRWEYKEIEERWKILKSVSKKKIQGAAEETIGRER